MTADHLPLGTSPPCLPPAVPACGRIAELGDNGLCGLQSRWAKRTNMPPRLFGGRAGILGDGLWMIFTPECQQTEWPLSACPQAYIGEPNKKIALEESDCPIETAPPPRNIALNPHLQDLTGAKFGRLTVVGAARHQNKNMGMPVFVRPIHDQTGEVGEEPGRNWGDRCALCQHLAYLKKESLWKSTGREVDVSFGMAGKQTRDKGRRGECEAKRLLTDRDWEILADTTAGLATGDLIVSHRTGSFTT